MGRDKAKGQKSPGQKHLHSRISYLYQAATYLASIENGYREGLQATVEEKEPYHMNQMHLGSPAKDVERAKLSSKTDSTKAGTEVKGGVGMTSIQQLPLPRLLTNHLKAVSLKGQVRLTPEMKRSICRRCDILLYPGYTSTSSLENKSRGGKKAWAEVLTLTCVSCGTVKRVPTGAKRQFRKADRPKTSTHQLAEPTGRQ